MRTIFTDSWLKPLLLYRIDIIAEPSYTVKRICQHENDERKKKPFKKTDTFLPSIDYRVYNKADR